MEFFDKIGKKASEAYKVTADKTGKIAKETKMKLKINELKSEINDMYKEIGRKVYEKHVIEDEISIKKDLETECTKIDVLSDEIEELLEQCLSLKDKKQCQNCYKEIDKNMNFCPECGAKQENEEEQKDDVKSVEVIETDGNKEEVENVEVTTNGVDNKIEIDETPGKADLAEEEKEQAQDNLEKTVAIEADVDLK